MWEQRWARTVRRRRANTADSIVQDGTPVVLVTAVFGRESSFATELAIAAATTEIEQPAQ